MAPHSTPLTALTIAGHDPSSGAGVTADLQVFAAHGIFGTSCITALTAQSTLGVKGIAPTQGDFLRECLCVLAADTPPAGVKIGMLATAANIHAVADFLETLPRTVPIVLDPILSSSSGRELLANEGLEILRSRLLPRVTWITPNWRELSILTGKPCQDRVSVELAGRAIEEDYPQLGLIATGGEAEPPADYVRLPDGEDAWIVGQHIVSTATHGTGCTFSTTFLCNLLQGKAPFEAARASKTFVEQAMSTAQMIGRGKGPMNLLWPLLRDTTGKK